jgi:hypothetical protein
MRIWCMDTSVLTWACALKGLGIFVRSADGVDLHMRVHVTTAQKVQAGLALGRASCRPSLQSILCRQCYCC